MLNTKRTAILIIALCSFFSSSVFAESRDAIATLREFYTHYFSYDYARTPKIPRPTLALSKSFRVEVKKNKKICAQYASGPCGWGADGDEYLDAQEYQTNLSNESSGMSIAEIQPNLYQVRLNVYPSIKDAGDYYQRTITYKMVNENGAWVVDDVMYADGVSTRKKMAEENAFVIAHPDPDVSAKKKK